VEETFLTPEEVAALMKKIHLFEKAKDGGYGKNFAVQQIIERGGELALL
jgi:hypothetical protein